MRQASDRPANSFGETVWRVGRFIWRALPLSGRARFRLRAAVLRWLRLDSQAISPESTIRRLRRVASRLSLRWLGKGAVLLLRGETAILKQHLASIVQHEINAEHRALQAAQPALDSGRQLRRLEPWPSSRPLVSIVVSHSNHGGHAPQTVASILAQTFHDFEVLVVGGGSPPTATHQPVGAGEAPKIRAVYSEGGQTASGPSRDLGVARALGKYVCCLDASHRLRPTYLEKSLFLLETYGYDVVSTPVSCAADESIGFTGTRYPTLADMLEANHLGTCAVFRRELWETAGGFRDAGLGDHHEFASWYLMTRFAALGARMANIVNEPLVVCNRDPATDRWPAHDPSPSQSRRIHELNRDVISEEALRRSAEARERRGRIADPVINMAHGLRSEARSRAILIALPFLILGGADRLISQIVAHLATRGYRVVIITTLHVGPEYGDTTQWFEAATPEIYHLPRFLEADRWRDFVLHLFDTREISLLWIIGSAFCYDLLPELKERYPELRTLDLLFNTVGHTAQNRKYQRHLDRIVVENREVAAWLVAAGESPSRISLIESGVDLERHRPRRKSADLLRQLGLPEDAFIVGFAGRLAEEKDPLAFVAMARRLRSEPAIFFVMTGAGPLADEVRAALVRERLENRVRYPGVVEDVRDYLALYDVLVLPSRFDGRPSVVLESLAMGVPVIASRVGALPDLIIDGQTGFLCDAGDIERFASHIRWLAEHPAERSAMGRAARAFTERHLDAAEMLQSYESLLRDLLDAGDRAADSGAAGDPSGSAAPRVGFRG